MIYDAEEYGEAIEPPVLRIAGKEWTGRLLSIEEIAPYQNKIAKAVANEKWDELREMVAIVTDLIFPPELTLKFWKWQPPASWYLLRLPQTTMLRLFKAFTEPQRQAMRVNPEPLGTEEAAAT